MTDPIYHRKPIRIEFSSYSHHTNVFQGVKISEMTAFVKLSLNEGKSVNNYTTTNALNDGDCNEDIMVKMGKF